MTFLGTFLIACFMLFVLSRGFRIFTAGAVLVGFVLYVLANAPGVGG